MKLDYQKLILKLKGLSRGAPVFLRDNIVWLFFAFLILSFFYGGYIFYKYTWSIANKVPEVELEKLGINEKFYREVLSKLKERERKFESDSRGYRDIFR